MSDRARMQATIEAAWEARADVTPATQGAARDAVAAALDLLDTGQARVAAPARGAGRDSQTQWTVHEWLKKAVLLSFRLYANELIPGAPGAGPWWDKIPSKFEGWTAADFDRSGVRAVPPSTVRRGAYLGRDVVLMPSFVNIGAYIGAGTMIDTWASIGSCAQVGAGCHISAGAGVGGVLEPLQAKPTIIEDNCFIGARSEVAEGVIVREGAVLAMGVFITASTKIVNRATGEISCGEVPPYSVVAPGALPSESGGPGLYCAVIVKQVDEKTRAKTSVNELLRS